MYALLVLLYIVRKKKKNYSITDKNLTFGKIKFLKFPSEHLQSTFEKSIE